MRTYLLRGRTNYPGLYNIYESEEEFNRLMPGTTFKTWAVTPYNEFEVGDWVKAEDGFIVQLLHIFRFNKLPRLLFRFPMTIVMVVVRKDKSAYFYHFYALFSPGHKASITGKQTTKFGLGTEAYFIKKLVLFGMNPFLAAKIINEKKYLSNLHELLQDEETKGAIMKNLTKFRESVEEKFSDERILGEIDDLLSRSRKGTMAHRQNIEFVLKLKEVIKEKGSNYSDRVPLGDGKRNNAEEVPYEEEKPPKLST